MKLVLYYGLEKESINDENYNSDDFIRLDISKGINTNYVMEEKYCHIYTKEYMKMMKERSLDELEFAINDIYYHNLKKVFALLEHVSFLLKTEDIDELILIGGNKNFRYFPFYFAEAHEDGFRFLHKSSWYFNALIYRAFKNKIKISFINEENIFKLNIIKRVRQVVLLFGISLLVFIKHIKKWKKFLGHHSENLQKKLILFPVRTVHQLRFILPTVNKVNEENECSPVIVFYEGLRAKDVDTFIFDQKMERYLAPMYQGKTLVIMMKSIIFSVKNFFKALFTKKEDLVMDVNGIKILIPLEEIKIESTIGVYYKVYYDLFNSFVQERKKKVSLIFSTEMTSKEAFLEKKASSNTKVPMYHFQTAMFEPKPMPVLPIGDKFFVNSKINKKLLSNIGQKSYGKVEYVGLFRYKIIKENQNISTKLEKILFATQPHDNQVTLQILEDLSAYIKKQKSSIKVFVKLHPRDRMENYVSLHGSYGLIFIDEQNIDLDRLIEESDLVISRFSSMLQEALIIGTPYLACLFTENDKSIKNDYLSDSLSAYSIKELIKKIENYEESIKIFNGFRNIYFEENAIKPANVSEFCKKEEE